MQTIKKMLLTLLVVGVCTQTCHAGKKRNGKGRKNNPVLKRKAPAAGRPRQNYAAIDSVLDHLDSQKSQKTGNAAQRWNQLSLDKMKDGRKQTELLKRQEANRKKREERKKNRQAREKLALMEANKKAGKAQMLPKAQPKYRRWGW